MYCGQVPGGPDHVLTVVPCTPHSPHMHTRALSRTHTEPVSCGVFWKTCFRWRSMDDCISASSPSSHVSSAAPPGPAPSSACRKIDVKFGRIWCSTSERIVSWGGGVRAGVRVCASVWRERLGRQGSQRHEARWHGAVVRGFERQSEADKTRHARACVPAAAVPCTPWSGRPGARSQSVPRRTALPAIASPV